MIETPARAAPCRCVWCGTDPLYVAYHDSEWGVPEYDDRALFEKLLLDGFQAGLSWITILRKRDAFRAAFDGFEPERIARYDFAKIEALMSDAGIVRNRAKIVGAVAPSSRCTNGRVLRDIYGASTTACRCAEAIAPRPTCLRPRPCRSPWPRS